MSAACAIDFGTSNSAIALVQNGQAQLLDIEAGFTTMPTAVFYAVEGLSGFQEPEHRFGRAAIAAYVNGVEGRLMRSMKSILGSTLAEQATEVGGGHAVRYLDVIATYLRHLRNRARQATGLPPEQLVLGRPVFFVDGDAQRDAAAQSALETAARQVGFTDVRFQYEPIAAALDYESTTTREQRVLVADIGGGTSDFSLVRVGPQRRTRLDRRDDILANHGIHVAGTDFDRQIELSHLLPTCGFRARGPTGREVPSRVYFDLATWHLINTVYAPGRVAELRAMKAFYAEPRHHARLMTVLEDRLGHALTAMAENAKITVAQARTAHVGLERIEADLHVDIEASALMTSIAGELERIAQAARTTAEMAGVAPSQVDAVYFTGGSTGLAALTDRIGAQFPSARQVHGNRFASVAQGLGRYAAQLFQR